MTPGFASWRFRTLMFGAVIVPPFARFLLRSHYKLLRPEVLLATATLVTVSCLLALLTRHTLLFRATLLTSIIVLAAVPFQALLATWMPVHVAWIIAAFLLLGGLSLFFAPTAAYRALLVFVLGAFLVDVAMAATSPRTFVPPAHAAPRGLPHVLYLILDEHAGTAGLPNDIPECAEARRVVENLFSDYGFRLYTNAYSNYTSTFDSVPSILNGRIHATARQYFPSFHDTSTPRTYSLGENRLFSTFLKNGYHVHVYQHAGIDYCLDFPVQRKTEYSQELRVIGDAAGSWTEKFKWIVGNYQRSDLLLNRVAGFFPFRFGGKFPGPASVPDWPGMLARDILAADHKTLFFAHLMTPHWPFLYRADGSVRPLEEWTGDRPAVRLDRPAYLERYTRYAQQVEYVTAQLRLLLGALRTAGVLDPMLIVVHGDHGSRIRLRDRAGVTRPESAEQPDRYDYVSPPGLRDLLDRFSALAAIKQPGARKGSRTDMKASVLAILARELPGAGSPLPADVNSVYLFEENGRRHAVDLPGFWNETAGE